MLILTASLAGVLALLAWRLGRASTVVRHGIVYLSYVILIAYAVWRVTETLPPLSSGAWALFAYALVGIELISAYIVVTGIEFPSSYQTWPTTRPFIVRTRDRVQEAAQQLDWYGTAPPHVCIFIPTYDEPWSVLERTLVGALNQNYPSYEVWVLDDGRRAWLREKAQAHAVEYVTRADNSHGKAGNLNSALARLRSRQKSTAFVALLDADFVARPEFLRKTLALMKSRDVGIVQTPQSFYNPDPFQRIFGVRNWPEEQRWWFDVEEPALDAAGGALCCGTACLLRIAALDAIGGGFPTESVTEDSLCSMKLKERGWRTAYLAERLAVGLAAEDLHGWFTQRVRWLQGEMQNRVSAGRPRNIYNLINYWLSFFNLSIYALRDLGWAVAHVGFWFTGSWVVDSTVLAAAGHFIPLWLVPLFWTWVGQGRRNYLITSAQFKLQRFVWLTVPLLSVLSSEVPRFRVTSKAVVRDGTVVHWRVLGWHALLASLLVLGIGYALLSPSAGARHHPWFWVNLLVSLYLVAELCAAMAPAVERPQRRIDDRYETRERVQIESGQAVVEGLAINISLGGLLLDNPCPPGLSSEATLTIDGVGPVPARRVREANGREAYRFDAAAARGALIRKLYCSEHYIPLPDSWAWSDGVLAYARWLGRSTAALPALGIVAGQWARAELLRLCTDMIRKVGGA